MPATITGTAGTYVNTASVPVDSDVASAASVQTPFQRLLDNEKSLYDQINTSGVLAVRNVASIAALQALTGMTNGQCCIVRGYGLFVYVDPDATAASTNWIVVPTAGTGRWFSLQYSLRNVANGIVALDGSAKVPSAQLRGQFVSSASIGLTSDSVMTAVTITSLTLAVAVQSGDIVVVDVVGAAKAASSPGAGDEPEIGLYPTGVTYTSAGATGRLLTSTTPLPPGIVATLTMTAAGTLTLDVKLTPQGAIVGATAYSGTSMRATVFRP